MGTKYLAPNAGISRRPTDTNQENGRICNPPRMAKIGGLDRPSKAVKRNSMTLKKPGASVK